MPCSPAVRVSSGHRAAVNLPSDTIIVLKPGLPDREIARTPTGLPDSLWPSERPARQASGSLFFSTFCIMAQENLLDHRVLDTAMIRTARPQIL